MGELFSPITRQPMLSHPFYRLIVLMLSLTLCACSDPKLLPSVAKDSIINLISTNHYSKSVMVGESPVPSFGDIHKEGNTYYGMLLDEGRNKENLEKLYACAQKGLLTISKVEQPEYENRVWYKLTVTDKAKDFVTVQRIGSKTLIWGPVKLADITVIDISSLSEPQKVNGRKICTAEFTYKYKPTPFGELYLSQEELDTTYKKSSVFVLEKGGWRISPEGFNNW